jgi:hypothetical protein
LSVWTRGTPKNRYTANNSAAFQSAVSAINNDETGEYWITIAGNFATTEISFTTNAGKTINIEGNSAVHSISNGNSSAPLFTLPSGIELVLGNNITLDGSGKSYPLVRINAGGTLVMNRGAKISRANICGVQVTGGTFTMNDGEISSNTFSFSHSSNNFTTGGGGVLVQSGYFTMYGGTISGNSVSATSTSVFDANAAGGGVALQSGSFAMIGGTINGNTVSSTASYDASAAGCGVYVGNGSFTMSGGAISDNSVSSFSANASTYYTSTAIGGGVYVGSGSFTMSG